MCPAVCLILLEENCSINTEITKYGYLQGFISLHTVVRTLDTQEHKINKRHQICCDHEQGSNVLCAPQAIILELHS